MANKKKQTKKVTPKKTKASVPHRSVHLLLLRLSAGLVLFIVSLLTYFTVTNTSLAPASVGTMTIDSMANARALENSIAASTTNYQLALKYPDNTHKSFAPSEAGMTVDTKQSAHAITKYLRSHLWQRLAWWQPITLKLSVKTDKTKLAAFITQHATLVTQAPQDAVLSAPDGVVTVTPETTGTGYQVEKPNTTLPSHVASLNTRSLPLQKATLAPSITAKNLESSKTKLETILNQTVTLTLAGRTITPSRATIANWVELTPVKPAHTVDVTINSGNIVAYIDKIADPYVYLPRDQLVMTMPDGPLTLDYGTSGTDISNKDAIAAQIAKQLLKAKPVAADLPITQASAKTVELQPYDKFIVVDTSAKRLYAYEKTKLVRTVPISAGAPATPTVLGQYKIYSKSVSQDMTGANADGSRYFQPAVPYVNYFYGSYAIHGNYWRPDSWFGSINSSHGCVGINDPEDAWIYNWAPIGTPVIVHE